MSIAAKLERKCDERTDQEDCAFNGGLSEYLAASPAGLDTVLKDGFVRIAEAEPDTQIIVDFREQICRDTIANQIIRYKDIFKLSGKPLRFPYILYLKKQGMERALLVFPYTEDSFLYAKGAYYCLTEQNSEFEDERNEIVSISPSDADQLVRTFRDLFSMHAGALQRRIDRTDYKTYDELKVKAENASKHLIDKAKKELPGMSDRTNEIYQLVVGWFLLKKVLYVQYMTDKSTLMTVHGGSVRKQRNQAKINADSITFIAYSDLWRMGTDLDEHKPSE